MSGLHRAGLRVRRVSQGCARPRLFGPFETAHRFDLEEGTIMRTTWDECKQIFGSLAIAIVLWAVVMTLTGCSGTPLSTREKGTLAGGAIGAGTGAIVGSAVGAPGAGAAIGGALGAGTGLLVGNELQQSGSAQFADAGAGLCSAARDKQSAPGDQPPQREQRDRVGNRQPSGASGIALSRFWRGPGRSPSERQARLSARPRCCRGFTVAVR